MKALPEFANGAILHARDIVPAAGDAPADGLAASPHGRGAFLMQAAVGDPDLAAVMPSTEVVDDVLGPAGPVPGSSVCLTIRAMLEQERTMVELFLVRLRGDAFVT